MLSFRMETGAVDVWAAESGSSPDGGTVAAVAESSSGPRQGEGVLGAGDDAQAAGAAGIGVRCVRGLTPMCDHLQLRGERERSEVGVVHASHQEDVVGADVDAVPLAFASSVIDDRDPSPGFGIAPFAGAVGVLGRPALLLERRCRFR